MKKRTYHDLIRIAVLIIAFSVLLYPTISNYLYEKNSSRVISCYDAEGVKLTEEEKQKKLEDARKYNQELLGNIELLDPFSPIKAEVDQWYESLLNESGTGMMGYIRIPKMQVELPIYHGTSESVLQTGVGHFQGTSLPVGGDSSHAVLTGHRGLPSKKLFTDMDQMEKGDVFYVKILGETFAYEVDQIVTVLPTQTNELTIVQGQDYVTLVTCTPYAVNTHRLLVRGHRIPYEEAVTIAADETVEAQMPFQMKMLIGAVILLLILLFIVIIYSLCHKKERRRSGLNRLKKLKIITLCMVLISVMVQGCFVASAQDPLGTVTISYHGCSAQDTKVDLSGAEFVIYKVGRFHDEMWNLTGEFANSKVSLEEDTASARTAQAKDLYDYAVANGIRCQSRITDAHGKTVFSDLEQGFYLIAQKNEVKASNNGVYISSPFLISVPAEIDGKLTYDIITEPKSGWEGETPSAPTVLADTPDAPATADAFPLELLLMSLTVSGTMLLYFAALKKRAK